MACGAGSSWSGRGFLLTQPFGIRLFCSACDVYLVQMASWAVPCAVRKAHLDDPSFFFYLFLFLVRVVLDRMQSPVLFLFRKENKSFIAPAKFCSHSSRADCGLSRGTRRSSLVNGRRQVSALRSMPISCRGLGISRWQGRARQAIPPAAGLASVCPLWEAGVPRVSRTASLGTGLKSLSMRDNTRTAPRRRNSVFTDLS